MIKIQIILNHSKGEKSYFLGDFSEAGIKFFLNNYFSEELIPEIAEWGGFVNYYYFIFENQDGSKFKTGNFYTDEDCIRKLADSDKQKINYLL